MNALCLPPALEFNGEFVPTAFGDAIGGDPAARARELAELGGFHRLRDFGVPEADLAQLGEAASTRGGNQANPRVATPEEITELFRTIY
jgi:alcohol dehydrogenase class IV